MALRHQLVNRPLPALWSVLEKEDLIIRKWVAGTSTTGPADGRWPEVESSIEYTLRSRAHGVSRPNHRT